MGVLRHGLILFSGCLIFTDSASATSIETIMPLLSAGDVRIEFSSESVSNDTAPVSVVFGRIEKKRFLVNDEAHDYAPLLGAPMVAQAAQSNTDKSSTVVAKASVPKAAPVQSADQPLVCAGVDAKYNFFSSERQSCVQSSRFKAFRTALKSLSKNVQSIQMTGGEQWTGCASRISESLRDYGLSVAWLSRNRKQTSAEITVRFCDPKAPVRAPVPQIAQLPVPEPVIETIPVRETPVDSLGQVLAEAVLQGDVRITIGGKDVPINEEGWFVYVSSSNDEVEMVVSDKDGERLRKSVRPAFYRMGYTHEKAHPSVTGVELAMVTQSESPMAHTVSVSGRKTQGPLPSLTFRAGYRPPKIVDYYVAAGGCAAWPDISTLSARGCGTLQGDWMSAVWGLNLFARFTYTFSAKEALSSTWLGQIEAARQIAQVSRLNFAIDAGAGAYYFAVPEDKSTRNVSKPELRDRYVPKSYGYPYPVIVVRGVRAQPVAWRLSSWAIPAYIPGLGLYTSYGAHLSSTYRFSGNLGATLFMMSDAAALPVRVLTAQGQSEVKTGSLRLNGVGLGLEYGL